jgi:phytoene dehydrogenase-like protein
MQGLADAVCERGGEVWTGATVSSLEVEGGWVRSAVVLRDRAKLRVMTDVVISNAGPAATVSMCGREHFSRSYLERMDRDLHPTANIVVNIASQHDLMRAPGIITFGITRRLCNMANLTATCPELAPAGWNLYVAYGVPIPAAGSFDEAAEVEATLDDLREQFKGFDERARILSVRVMKGDWPAQRSIAGLDLPQTTAIENLYNVGDGVREYASGGVQACAETAKLVAERVLASGLQGLREPAAGTRR